MWLPFFLNPTNQFKGVALAPDAVAKIDELLTRFLIGIILTEIRPSSINFSFHKEGSSKETIILLR